MTSPFELAQRYGIEVSYADLGDWGAHELRSEYDPGGSSGPVIRINVRVVARLSPSRAAWFCAIAVAHELYHHREHLGEVPTYARRTDRERAADEFARSLVR